MVTAEKTEKRKFTCFDGNGVVVVRAESPAEADEMNCYWSDLIVAGTLKDIGAKRISEGIGIWAAPEEEIWAEDTKLEPGTVCTLTVGDPIRVADATFLGEEEINNEGFLSWLKNDVPFWTSRASTKLTYVGGQRVGLRPDWYR